MENPGEIDDYDDTDMVLEMLNFKVLPQEPSDEGYRPVYNIPTEDQIYAAEYCRLQAKIDELTEKNMELERYANALSEEFQIYNTRHQQELLDKERELEDVQKKAAEYRKQVDCLIDHNVDLKNQLSAKKADYKCAKLSISKYAEEAKEHLGTISLLRKELNVMQNQKLEVESKVELLERKIHDNDLEKRYADSQNKLKMKSAETEKRKNDIRVSSDRAKRLKKQSSESETSSHDQLDNFKENDINQAKLVQQTLSSPVIPSTSASTNPESQTKPSASCNTFASRQCRLCGKRFQTRKKMLHHTRVAHAKGMKKNIVKNANGKNRPAASNDQRQKQELETESIANGSLSQVVQPEEQQVSAGRCKGSHACPFCGRLHSRKSALIQHYPLCKSTNQTLPEALKVTKSTNSKPGMMTSTTHFSEPVSHVAEEKEDSVPGRFDIKDAVLPNVSRTDKPLERDVVLSSEKVPTQQNQRDRLETPGTGMSVNQRIFELNKSIRGGLKKFNFN